MIIEPAATTAEQITCQSSSAATMAAERRYERYREIGSTRSWLRGTLERRLAHLFDRIGGIRDRLHSRSSNIRRRVDFGDHPDIPV